MDREWKQLNERHGWTSTSAPHPRPGPQPTDRAGSGAKEPQDLRLTNPPPIPPETPELYVSFAWKQGWAEPLLDGLIAGLQQHGIEVLRDSGELQPGDRISEFMKPLSAGRCVLLVIMPTCARHSACHQCRRYC